VSDGLPALETKVTVYLKDFSRALAALVADQYFPLSRIFPFSIAVI
jgi:hypothetical protein